MNTYWESLKNAEEKPVISIKLFVKPIYIPRRFIRSPRYDYNKPLHPIHPRLLNTPLNIARNKQTYRVLLYGNSFKQFARRVMQYNVYNKLMYTVNTSIS